MCNPSSRILEIFKESNYNIIIFWMKIFTWRFVHYLLRYTWFKLHKILKIHKKMYVYFCSTRKVFSNGAKTYYWSVSIRLMIGPQTNTSNNFNVFEPEILLKFPKRNNNQYCCINIGIHVLHTLLCSIQYLAVKTFCQKHFLLIDHSFQNPFLLIDSGMSNEDMHGVTVFINRI